MSDSRSFPPDRSRYPLANFTVGVSVSDVPAADLAALGLGTMHVEHAFWEITRQLLALGANVAYGGDHRVGGYTRRLFDVVRTYTRDEVDPKTRILNYLAWPIHRSLSPADRSNVTDVCTLVDCALPADLADDPVVLGLKPTDRLPPDPAPNRRVWVRCLTAMRQQMNAEIDARILLGGRYGGIVDGKLDRFLGKYAGLVEEGHLAIICGKPTYLLGGFGGCTAVIVEALEGAVPAPLTIEYHTKADPVYKDLFKTQSLAPDDPIDYDRLRTEFASAGSAGLKNGLDQEVNRRLFSSDDVDEAVAVVIAGLERITGAVAEDKHLPVASARPNDAS